MNNRTDHGFLILADVSGFTAFVTTTELEHGSEIIAALLDEVVGHLSPPLEIQEIEGDAVFALGGEASPLSKSRLLEVLEGAFAAFKTRQRTMQDAETCYCGACQQIGTLDLKMAVPRAVPAPHGGRAEPSDRHRGHPGAPALEERAGANRRLRAPHRAGAAVTRDRRGGGRATGPHRALRAPGRRALLRARPHSPPLPHWGEGRVRGPVTKGSFTRRRSRRRRRRRRAAAPRARCARRPRCRRPGRCGSRSRREPRRAG